MAKGVLKVWTWAALAVIALFGAYVVAGYTLVPGIIRSQAVKWADEKLHKPLALGEIRFDPFRLAVDIDDIALPSITAKTAATPAAAAAKAWRMKVALSAGCYPAL